jgi:hypothetical protein
MTTKHRNCSTFFSVCLTYIIFVVVESKVILICITNISGSKISLSN